MAIDFTSEQRDFAQAVAAFCRKECGTREQRDALTGRSAHHHNQGLYLKMAELGWLGITVPEEYGGSAGTAVDTMGGSYGYATEVDMEGHVRKALVSSIYGGTNEIQRDIIDKTSGL